MPLIKQVTVNYVSTCNLSFHAKPQEMQISRNTFFCQFPFWTKNTSTGHAFNCNVHGSTWQINCLLRSQRVKDSRKSIVFIFIMIFVLANYAIVAFEVEKLRSTGLKLVMTICILMCVACCYNYHLCFILYNRGMWLNTMRKIKNLDDSRYIPIEDRNKWQHWA